MIMILIMLLMLQMEKIIIEREIIRDFEKQRKDRLTAYYRKLTEKLENGEK